MHVHPFTREKGCANRFLPTKWLHGPILQFKQGYIIYLLDGFQSICQTRWLNRCQIYVLKCHGGDHSKRSNLYGEAIDAVFFLVGTFRLIFVTLEPHRISVLLYRGFVQHGILLRLLWPPNDTKCRMRLHGPVWTNIGSTHITVQFKWGFGFPTKSEDTNADTSPWGSHSGFSAGMAASAED